MKIASYNIMSGGFAGYDSAAPVPERLPQIQKVLVEIAADVVGLIDTFRWDRLYSSAQLQDMFGYEYVTCINLNDTRMSDTSNGLTLLSKQAWTDCKVARIATRDALVASFEINRRTVTLALAYLDDLSEDVRLAQIQALLGVQPDILMGDLNTIAPSDTSLLTRGLQDFYSANPSLQEELGPIIQDMQRGDVIELLEARGFVDAGANGKPTLPTQLFPAATTKPFLRLDYCLHKPAIAVSDFTVHDTPAAHRASDHLPIYFTI